MPFLNIPSLIEKIKHQLFIQILMLHNLRHKQCLDKLRQILFIILKLIEFRTSIQFCTEKKLQSFDIKNVNQLNVTSYRNFKIKSSAKSSKQKSKQRQKVNDIGLQNLYKEANLMLDLVKLNEKNLAKSKGQKFPQIREFRSGKKKFQSIKIRLQNKQRVVSLQGLPVKMFKQQRKDIFRKNSFGPWQKNSIQLLEQDLQ